MELYLLDGCVLFGLLKVVSDDDFEFRSTLWLGLAIGLLALGLDWLMLQWVGQKWHFLSAVLIGAITTVVLMYLWGLDVKRALFVAVFFDGISCGAAIAVAEVSPSRIAAAKTPWFSLVIQDAFASRFRLAGTNTLRVTFASSICPILFVVCALMDIAVLISAYNNAPLLRRCLLMLTVQTDSRFQIVIADDGSNESVKEVLELPEFRALAIQHHWHEDQGFRKTKILNRALAEMHADYVILTDADCLPRNDFIAQHRKIAKPGTFVSGGIVNIPIPCIHNSQTRTC